jgi:hypothetical protein
MMSVHKARRDDQANRQARLIWTRYFATGMDGALGSTFVRSPH